MTIIIIIITIYLVHASIKVICMWKDSMYSMRI